MATDGLCLRVVKKMPTKKKSNSQFDLSIVIPAYREGKRIGKSLDELAVFLRKEKTLKDLSIEVIVVSADSTDDTHEVVLKKKKKFVSLTLLKPGPKVGKGRDVKYAMLRAKGKSIVFMDADLATPLRHLPQFYTAQQKGADVVIATRNLLKHHPSPARRLLSNAGNLIFRIAGGVWVEDSQCGFKMFTYDAAQICFTKLNIMGWGFDMEVLAIAKANKLKVVSKRANDWISVPEGTFDSGVLKNSLISLGELGYIFWNRIRSVYKVR